jgi:AcrR family transcriptional regulator
MNRRDLLLDKAEELFAEHGFEGTSIRQLAGVAGMNVSMISYYFGSKEKLFEALVEERTSTIRDRLKDLNEQQENPVVRLEEMIRLYVDRFAAQPRFHRMLFHEVTINRRPELQRSVAGVLMRNVHELRRTIQDGIREGVFRDVDVDLTIVSMVGTVTQLVASSPEMHQRMLDVPAGFPLPAFVDLRERLYQHLRQMMMSHLLK